MNKLGYKQFSERHRPHIHPPGANVFVTYRLAGSIPKATLQHYRAKKAWLADQVRRVSSRSEACDSEDLKERLQRFEREWTIKFEATLHKAETGPIWTKDERVADAVAETLHRRDGDAYRLDCFSVMSNHVHVVFKPFLSEADLHHELNEDGHSAFASERPGLSRIMHLLKGRSARECNSILSRRGQFWEHESFDHVIRAGKFSATIKYVLNNPVKAGLVRVWRDWRWNYCRPDIADKF
jgi:REP-associated tyrosine transposase